jgi:probable HAF family extracellular repeat protein
MNSATEMAVMKLPWRRCVGALCASGLLACGGSGGGTPTALPNGTLSAPELMVVGADQARADVVGELSTVARGGSYSYSVVLLGSGSVTELPSINRKNQVVLSVNGANGNRVLFFDGDLVHDIGTLGGADAYAPALNAAGQVAGYSSTVSGDVHAFRWSKSGGMIDLGTLYNAAGSKALAINGHGQIVGYSDPAQEPVQAFVWSESDGMIDLGRLSDGLAVAQAINDNGMIAGFSDAADGNAHGFGWTRDKGMFDLGTLGGIDSYATLINHGGQIAGYSAIRGETDFVYRGFVWNKATGMVDIGALNGLGSAPLAINADGLVAGVSDVKDGAQHAIVWRRGRGMTDLGTLGGAGSRALGINNNGDVVGLAATGVSEFDYHAFLWTRTKGMLDLNRSLANAPPGLVLTEAIAISDKGAIVANSTAGLVLLLPGAKGNDAPVVGPVAPSDPVAAGSATTFAVSFTDQNRDDTHVASWSWGDGCANIPGSVTESRGVGTARAVHRYCTPGIYALRVTVTDSTRRSASVTRNVVVYDPSTVAAAGDGWFMSPQGALRQDRVQAGRASFSFVSALTPAAVAGAKPWALQFHVANLNFQSTAYDALSLAGGRVQYQGSGTINGAGKFKFLLSAVTGAAATAGAPSRLRMKIWHLDTRTDAEVVDYDNARPVRASVAGAEGSELGGGQIVLGR